MRLDECLMMCSHRRYNTAWPAKLVGTQITIFKVLDAAVAALTSLLLRVAPVDAQDVPI